VEASLGAAVLAAYAVGLIDAAQVQKSWVKPVQRAVPNAEAQVRYTALFEQYVALYPALQPIMHRLRETEPPATGS
jgi:ribulokinase